MTRLTGQVKGEVCYREGDGIMMKIPRGPCEIEVEELDITLAWSDGDVRSSAAIPKSEYEQYLASGALVLV